jgi:hypothetical protein
MRDKIFISYSHLDNKKPAYLNELQTMLKTYERMGTVDAWADTRIKSGVKWRDEIENALKNAKAAVLLVSTHFLASEFIAQHELPPLLEAAKKDGLRVFWVCLDNCPYENTEIKSYQAVHDLAKSLSDLLPNKRKAVWKCLCQELEQVTPLPPKTEDKFKHGLIEEVFVASSREDNYSKAESEEEAYNTSPPELLEAIIAILEESDAAAKELAKHFKLEYKTMDECRDYVAQKAIDSDLKLFFEIALQVKAALRDSKPPDHKGMVVMSNFVQAVLPARYHETGLDHGRNKIGDNRDGPVQLLASHKTIAEIYMARRDRRSTQFVVDVDGKMPSGDGLIAYEEGNLERGRDRNWEQFERDVMKAFTEKFESRFGAQWKDIVGVSFINSFSILDKNKSEQYKNWLSDMIGGVLDVNSKQRASNLHYKGCDFTYYFLIETPEVMDEESKNGQDAVLQRLQNLFRKIAFLRLAPPTPLSAMELLPYLHLHALLNPDENPR